MKPNTSSRVFCVTCDLIQNSNIFLRVLKMSKIPGDSVIIESNQSMFQLTTHKVRFNSIKNGKGTMTSILLEHITSCEIKQKTHPALLILAIAFCIVGIASYTQQQNTQSSILFLIIAGTLFFVYSASKMRALIICSQTARIELDVKAISLKNVVDIVDEIELAITNKIHKWPQSVDSSTKRQQDHD